MFRQFAENELWPIAGKIDKSGEFPAEQVHKMGELGLMGIGSCPPGTDLHLQLFLEYNFVNPTEKIFISY